MLKIKPNCENCGKPLPNTSQEAMICSFECTFCVDCVSHILHNVCPNCGGGLEKRPVRPSKLIEKYPASSNTFIQPIDKVKFGEMLAKYKSSKPNER